MLNRPAWPERLDPRLAWLGDAVEIKDPTAAEFRQQGGSNLLVIGQHEQAALAVFESIVVSLAAHHRPAPDSEADPRAAKFYILDGTPTGDPRAEVFKKLAEVLPHEVNVVRRRNVAEAVGQLAAEVQRRQEVGEADGPTIYLLIYDAGRLRPIRRDEDDFGFSASLEEKPASAAQQLANIVREGPDLGVHTIVWADTLLSLERVFDRQSVRQFEMRVLFQMSATDSSTLIDTPAASKLGRYRGLYYSEEHGRSEKFRPYGIADPDWLEQVGQQLRRRVDRGR